jgi:hypothetical protein
MNVRILHGVNPPPVVRPSLVGRVGSICYAGSTHSEGLYTIEGSGYYIVLRLVILS